jgi:hypothetical protein
MATPGRGLKTCMIWYREAGATPAAMSEWWAALSASYPDTVAPYGLPHRTSEANCRS